ncbi:unnamed protein product [Caenorhabditis angaria]|uniref:Enhancer of polycomb-like protein n=1 Tax=Caenorhabditis angaria TaxID=860376 RepID=A0A9P1IG92_9PELO|nr:unnamed protein product [Caenorhabditis angaria]
MASVSKAFRARAFDANKSMAIYWGQELPDLSECATGNRAVTQMPSGMEKEEEMESHLQDAILAQQASTSGVQVNHVIPTPKVNQVDVDRYNLVYQNRNKNRSKYIKVHAWQALEKDEPEYDYDTEDEEWLNDHPHIEANVLERIFDTVETNSSETQIASEDSVLNIHKNIDPTVIYEVYEYWLSKRTSAATTSGCIGVGGLIPRVRTECRKDGQGSVNPYVAFRRRAEKMQTRKNRKNDEDSYEKILKLVHDMSKARQLFDMTTKREKGKNRMEMSDFGTSTIYEELNEKLRTATKPLVQINGSNQDEKKKKKAKRTKGIDKDLVSKAWLKKNAESWNRPPSLFGNVGGETSQESAKPARQPLPDGKYTFKRRRGCVYRAALPVQYNHNQPRETANERVPQNMRYYETFLPNSQGNVRSIGFARKRVGRGGRIVLDRIPRKVETEEEAPEVERRVPRIVDPWEEECVIDTSRSFGARMHPFAEFLQEEEEDEQLLKKKRYFERADRVNFDDEDVEKEWISRYCGAWRDVNANGAEKASLETSDSSDKKAECARIGGGGDGEFSEVERMEVDDAEIDEEEAENPSQISETSQTNGIKAEILPTTPIEEPPPLTNGNGNLNGNGNGYKNHHELLNEEERMIKTIKIDMPREDSPPSKIAHETSGDLSLSGNELAGRVEPTPVPAKMCGTVSDSDEWREPSGSPSESNSSTEWERRPTTYKTSATNTQMIVKVVDVEEEEDEKYDDDDDDEDIMMNEEDLDLEDEDDEVEKRVGGSGRKRMGEEEEDETDDGKTANAAGPTPSIKDALSTVTLMERKNKFILPPSKIGT